jgi:hypothetical protein
VLLARKMSYIRQLMYHSSIRTCANTGAAAGSHRIHVQAAEPEAGVQPETNVTQLQLCSPHDVAKLLNIQKWFTKAEAHMCMTRCIAIVYVVAILICSELYNIQRPYAQ